VSSKNLHLIGPGSGVTVNCSNYTGDPADEWEDGQGRVFRAVRHVNEIQCVHDPHKGEWREFDIGDFERDVEVAPPDSSVFEVFDHVLAELGDERYVAGPTGGITAVTLLNGTEQGLMMHALQPEVVEIGDRPNLRKIDELPWQLALASEWPRLQGLLVEPVFFRQAWEHDEFEVKAYWAQIEDNSPLLMVEAYRGMLENPAQHQAQLHQAQNQLSRHHRTEYNNDGRKGQVRDRTNVYKIRKLDPVDLLC